jgi:hypothetical protein
MLGIVEKSIISLGQSGRILVKHARRDELTEECNRRDK